MWSLPIVWILYIRFFYFFSEKKHFQILVFTFIAKKKSQKECTIFFSVYQNCKTKKIAISKISNKKFRKKTVFRKNQIQKKFAKILWKKSSQKYFCEKRNFRRKKFNNKNFHQKKKFVKKNFLTVFRKKKFENNFKNNFGNFSICETKFGWNSVNFPKKKSKKFWK